MRASRRIPLMNATGITVTPLTLARTGAIAIADAADQVLIIGGGADVVLSTDIAECYGGRLIRSTVSPINSPRIEHTGAGNENYKLVGGGISRIPLDVGGYSETTRDTVDAYDINLAHTLPTVLSAARSRLASATNGTQITFAGGIAGTTIKNTVDAYSAALVRSIPTTLAVARYLLAGIGNASHMLFAGGYTSTANATTNAVNAYDTTLTRLTPATLYDARAQAAAARIGNYLLIAGGQMADASPYMGVDVYDASLTHSQLALGVARRIRQGISGVNYALFGGGNFIYGYGSDEDKAHVDAFDATLTHYTPNRMLYPHYDCAGAANARYMILAGGYVDGIGNSRAIDVYNNNLEHFASIQ